MLSYYYCEKRLKLTICYTPKMKTIPERQLPQNTFYNIRGLHELDTIRVEAHRHDFYLIMYVKEAVGYHQVDFVHSELKANHLYLISPNQVHIYDAQAKGEVLYFASELADMSLLDKVFFPFASLPIKLDSKKQQQLESLFLLLSDEIHHQIKNIEVVRAYIRIVLENIVRIDREDSSSEHTCILELNRLINRHFKDEQQSEFYVQKLSISNQHLNKILKKSVGKTLLELINRRIIVEAKRELIFTHKTANEIGEELGFFDASYFTKFFKRLSGFTPIQFRNKFKIYHN